MKLGMMLMMTLKMMIMVMRCCKPYTTQQSVRKVQLYAYAKYKCPEMCN